MTLATTSTVTAVRIEAAESEEEVKITVLDPEPEPYDAFVAAAWADEVAAGRGTEGQVFNNGLEFHMFSTVQGAVDSGCQNIVVSPGEYDENVEINK